MLNLNGIAKSSKLFLDVFLFMAIAKILCRLDLACCYNGASKNPGVIPV
ncbi:hypothetical protein D3OALGA1CA_5144 [Olavius algarvensis associated proteobacterium Delta 3]|nr:hypothetical protein D3OALGB2SA_3032 [Olavius algarvensis associated proteobacterium Delta 3]CAB5162495.1 hypothetical protein D3OALGA1CA_5144 [Olavius algarvensis associated proteobacterium Delta 3]